MLDEHDDAAVAALLTKVFQTLPSGGTLYVSEPMTGGARPTRAGNAYFAIYTMAMQTGRTRSPKQIAAALSRAGFSAVHHHPTVRPFVTSIVTGRKL